VNDHIVGFEGIGWWLLKGQVHDDCDEERKAWKKSCLHHQGHCFETDQQLQVPSLTSDPFIDLHSGISWVHHPKE